MSANLMEVAGGHAFAYNAQRGLPWHNLGTPVNGAMTWQEAMQKASLGWSVSKRQLSIAINGVYVPVEAWGIFRDDNNRFLGAVGDKYTCIQNAEAFDFVDALLESSGSHYDTAGALGLGERIFVSATIPYSIAPNRAPDDKTNCYLMMETSHDGSLSATAKLTTVRVVCQNTLSQALNSSGFGTLKVRHTESGQDRLDKAKRIFQGVEQSVQSLKTKFDTLAGRKISKIESRAIMDRLFGHDWQDSAVKRNQIERIGHLFESNDRNAFPEIRGSAYAMLQSVTNWVDHERTTRQTEGMQGMRREAVQAQAAIFNGGDSLKRSALEIILEETEHSAAMPEPALVFAPTSSRSTVANIMDMVQA